VGTVSDRLDYLDDEYDDPLDHDLDELDFLAPPTPKVSKAKRIAALEKEVADLREELDKLRQSVLRGFTVDLDRHRSVVEVLASLVPRRDRAAEALRKAQNL
jgi:hypothetical protein